MPGCVPSMYMRREFGSAASILVGLAAALMMFSIWSAPAESRFIGTATALWIEPLIQSGVAPSLPPHSIKKPLQSKKGWNGHYWLFLPSTVLAVSGSRGHWD